jgi:galactokinase
VCLFGEHQDYLRLPVVPCAISLRIAIEGKRRHDALVHLALPDVGAEISFSLAETLAYRQERDYFRSAANVLRRAGFTFAAGFDCTVRGEIPINAGTSSSSALVVTWVNFLAQMSDQQQQLSPEECARLAHAAEVLEFHEPGGMMDHFAAACGGVLALTFHPALQIEKLSPSLQPFVLGDSGEPKDTKGILARVKQQVLDIVAQLAERHPDFSLHTVALEELDRYTAKLNHSERTLLWGTLRNRDLTQEALALLRHPEVDDLMLGELLTEQQVVLRDILKISTLKIDRMMAAALRAGAYGGKINGSGGGGCMFVYAPENPQEVAQAITAAGGKAYIVHVDAGTRNESL